MNQRKIVQSPLAPPALGPYSQAVVSGGFLYISGQLGIDATTGSLVESSKEEQFEQIFKNVGFILQEAGCGFDDVVKCTGFLICMDDFPVFNAVYSRHFGSPYPARSVFQVSALPKKGALAELEVIAKMTDNLSF
ncbi:MAG: RidA family protein [Bacteroidales bacterium]|jgi:2-iminobutanoate/2-iminopropanoate deaminase|nr:RidA family protein [Bacteroidales bacterium]MDD2823957.1 RidA family protein [Bacteroidales bacterium]MDD3100634.1 RidA family protein [Bacteroidales bacterium]MDD3639299.1 RidA family protein [Bacteroidales bacterium]MDD3943972.1 RidA family protein [Bacteroidales bacterium]